MLHKLGDFEGKLGLSLILDSINLNKKSQLKSVKEGTHKIATNTEAGRRLIFKLQGTGEAPSTPSVDQMAETLLKVSFKKGEGNTTQGQVEPITTGESNVQITGQTLSNRKEIKDMLPSIDQKKRTWQRIARAGDEEQTEGHPGPSAMGKRGASEATLTERDQLKKTKYVDDTWSANTRTQAEADQQPRPAS